MAFGGAVVSKPMPKKTTSRSGFSRAIFERVQRRVHDPDVAALALIRNRSRPLPGTRSMSPKEQKITSGREAISSARSISSSGVTQTGQPGPWIISTWSGISWSMPCRMIEWVCPPQTSMIAHGPGDGGVDVVEQPLGQLGVVELVDVPHRRTSS